MTKDELIHALRVIARTMPDNVSGETCMMIERGADALECAHLVEVGKMPKGRLFLDADGDICHDQGGHNLVACPAYDDGIDGKILNGPYVEAMVLAFNGSVVSGGGK